MSYYIILYIIVMLLMLIASKRESNAKFCIFLSAALIFFFFAFRVGFTPDYYDYETDFRAGLGTDNERYTGEPLFVFLTSHLTYRWALILQTTLICICYCLAFYKYVDHRYYLVSISVLFWYICFMLGCFSGFRSSFITVALFLSIFIRSRLSNQKIAFLVSVFLLIAASCIHKSGWLVLPLLLFTGRPLSDRIYKIVIGFSIVAILMSLFFANTINTWVATFVDDYAEDFAYYMQDEIADTMYMSIANLVSLASKAVLFFMTFNFAKNDYSRLDNICILLSSFFFLLLMMPNIGLISRFQYYFLFPTLIGISIVLRELNSKTSKLIYIGSLFTFGFFNIYNFVQADYSKLFAFYQNIFFN